MISGWACPHLDKRESNHMALGFWNKESEKNYSPFLITKSSTSAQAHLLPSISTFAVTMSSDSQPPVLFIDTASTTSNSLCTSVASSLSKKALSSSTRSMFSPLPTETSPVLETSTTSKIPYLLHSCP
ncbi:hypothetical protein TNCV_4622891 [Trichonephila clavipes]|nr:hypothetical protein TNCV_4622891 [Trichonephila clavipes]